MLGFYRNLRRFSAGKKGRSVMAEFIQAPLKGDSDIKIFILYLLGSIGRPLEFVELHDIVVQDGIVPSFDFCMNFPALLEAGHISAETADGREVYTVTASGQAISEELSDRLLQSTRARALSNALILLEMRDTGESCSCETEALADGKYRVHFRMTENGEETLHVSAAVGSRYEADKIKANLRRRPDLYQRAFHALLSSRASVLRGRSVDSK